MDAIVAGAGLALRDCRDVLQRAGFRVGSTLADDSGCPVILGDVPQVAARALDLVEAGRHVLVAEPAVLSPSQVGRLLSARRPRQAVFLWSGRRHHPSFRLMLGLIRSEDPSWRPRSIRQITLSTERPVPAIMSWRALETLAVALDLAASQPIAVNAAGSRNAARGAYDFLALSVHTEATVCFVELGLSEALERRELVIVADGRRAYLDELDPYAPLRLFDEDDANCRARRPLSWPPPDERQIAQLQCLAFLEATNRAGRSQAEADLWLRVLSCWRAAEASLAEHGARVEVHEAPPARLRVINGKGLGAATSLPSLRIVS